MIQLVTCAHDIVELDQKANNICDKVKAKGLKEFERLDIEKNLQPFDILEVTTSLIDTKVEIIWELKEHDNTMKLCWCSGTVIALKHNDKVIVEQDDETPDTQEELSPFRFNKSTKKGWRLCVDKQIIKS